MTNNKNRVVRKYLRKVNSELICPRQEKKQVLRSLREEVTAFVAKNPEADLKQIEQSYGTPEYIAELCLKDMDSSALRRKLKIKRTIIRIIIAAAVVGLLLWVSYFTYELLDNDQFKEGYSVYEIN